MFILLIYHGRICTCLNFVESTFCSGIVEKLCPLKTFRRNYYFNFKGNIYSSRFYNTNSYDRTEWKCHTVCWIFGKTRKLKTDNIYWNKLCQGFKTLNVFLSELRKSCFKQKCYIHARNCSKTNAIQSRGSKVPLWKLIPTYVYWSCIALNLICWAWNLKTKTDF